MTDAAYSTQLQNLDVQELQAANPSVMLHPVSADAEIISSFTACMEYLRASCLFLSFPQVFHLLPL